MIPSFTSGCPSRAFSEANRTVQAMASSSPPPSANPFTAATDGLPMVSRSRNACCPRRAYSQRLDGREHRQFVDIRAGDKGFFAGSGEDGRADGAVPGDALEGVLQFRDHGA